MTSKVPRIPRTFHGCPKGGSCWYQARHGFRLPAAAFYYVIHAFSGIHDFSVILPEGTGLFFLPGQVKIRFSHNLFRAVQTGNGGKVLIATHIIQIPVFPEDMLGYIVHDHQIELFTFLEFQFRLFPGANINKNRENSVYGLTLFTEMGNGAYIKAIFCDYPLYKPEPYPGRSSLISELEQEGSLLSCKGFPIRH